jgi:hypothetical protein
VLEGEARLFPRYGRKLDEWLTTLRAMEVSS